MYDQDSYGTASQRPYRPRRTMARASLTLGILSLVFCSIFYVSLPCGALAILCAVLSRMGEPMAKRCRIAVLCGVCGIAATLTLTVSMVKKTLSDPTMRAWVEYYLQAYTGDSTLDLEEELTQAFPFLQNLFEDEATEKKEIEAEDKLLDEFFIPEEEFFAPEEKNVPSEDLFAPEEKNVPSEDLFAPDEKNGSDNSRSTGGVFL